jgi:hypothetical protein
MRRRWLVLVALLVAGTAGPASAGDGADVGATAATPDQLISCPPGHFFVQSSTHGAPSYTTERGVITSWSMLAGPSDAATVALSVLGPHGGSAVTVMGTTAPRQLTPGRLNTFLTRVPVTAGGDLALYVSPGSASAPGCYFATTEQFDWIGFNVGGDIPQPATGQTLVVSATLMKVRLNLSAHIEPDADGDGYGDLTQDACPTLVNSHTDCTPPNTFLKGAVPHPVVRHGDKATVKVGFVSTEPATFSCRLDKGHWKPCTRGFKAEVGPGKHAVTVTATDAVGNVDLTPLVVRFKAKPVSRG